MKANEFKSMLVRYLGGVMANEDEKLDGVKNIYYKVIGFLEAMGKKSIPKDKIEDYFKNLNEFSKMSSLEDPKELERALTAQYYALGQLVINRVDTIKRHRFLMRIALVLFWLISIPICFVAIAKECNSVDLWLSVLDLLFGIIFFTYEFISDKENKSHTDLSNDFLNDDGVPAAQKQISISGLSKKTVIAYGDGNSINISENNSGKGFFVFICLMFFVLSAVLVLFGTGVISITNNEIGIGNTYFGDNSNVIKGDVGTYIDTINNPGGTINIG